jgi:hypothetical protein
MTNGERAVVLHYTAVDEDRLQRVKDLKRLAAAYYDALESAERDFCPSRDLSLAKTKVQEASMWATRGLTNPT